MRNKFLFVVSEFFPAGAQREMYELDLEFKRRDIDIEILSLLPLNSDSHFPDFFYEKHLKLGTKIRFIDSFIDNRLICKLLRILGFYTRDLLQAHFDEFTDVFFMGEYVFHSIQERVRKFGLSRFNIFVMCSRFQGEYYRAIGKDLAYNFISGFDTEEQVVYEFEGYIQYSHTYLPLLLTPTLDYKIWKFKNINSKKKIGIFTRLSRDKPLDPFFYAFKLLLEWGVKVELHIFGSGVVEEAGYDRYINTLGIKNSVLFRGHQEDIKETINKEQLDLIWFQGYLNRPAGYAGFDACLTGTPQLFWDFYDGNNSDINNLDSVYPHFKHMGNFLNASLKVLNDKNYAETLAQRQFSDVFNNRNMSVGFEDIKYLFD